ncbi:tyrosine-type recombinase/integrase [Amycolatopsis thermoflava]|uniref:tyrosine-type recombinase/integrase n=1 Tax=Amycolatopsis thermoflava TaxID=84480 RepID=UPI003668A0B7
MRDYLDRHDHPHAEHQLLRRSNFSRRAARPAADENLHQMRPEVRVQPILPGLRFHGLRHSHKTWLIADGIPEVAQSRRLGHRIPDEISDIYSHVAAEVEARLLDSHEAHPAVQRGSQLCATRHPNRVSRRSRLVHVSWRWSNRGGAIRRPHSPPEA